MISVLELPDAMVAASMPIAYHQDVVGTERVNTGLQVIVEQICIHSPSAEELLPHIHGDGL